MPLIEKMCDDYIAMAASPCLDERGRQVLRRAFFAGANASFIALQEANHPSIPIPIRILTTQNIVSELAAFQAIEKALKPQPQT